MSKPIHAYVTLDAVNAALETVNEWPVDTKEGVFVLDALRSAQTACLDHINSRVADTTNVVALPKRDQS